MNATVYIDEVRKLLDAARADGRSVGFVPTMGALHEGHRSLIRRARAETAYVVVSIFVNPTQFGPSEDLGAYPRTLAADLDACRAEGTDLVFHPDASEMYPGDEITPVVVDRITEPMEGIIRPGHFEGVTRVCAKLFNIVGECRAYLGEKDAQQLRVVRRMARDLLMPVEVVGCPTVRDADGLALSSRNAYLSSDERERALALPRALEAVRAATAGGERDAAELAARGRAVLEQSELDGIDYLELVNPETLERVERVGGGVLVCGAIRVGKTRLIDNLSITPEDAR